MADTCWPTGTRSPNSCRYHPALLLHAALGEGESTHQEPAPPAEAGGGTPDLGWASQHTWSPYAVTGSSSLTAREADSSNGQVSW